MPRRARDEEKPDDASKAEAKKPPTVVAEKGRFSVVVETAGPASVVPEPEALAPTVRMLGVPCSGIAMELGQPKVKNVAALGALAGATGLLPEETFLAAIRSALGGKAALVPVNEEAFRRGLRAVRETSGA